MELRNLHTFLVAAELKNFTKAGQKLGYTQSTITAQIQQLEKELGMPLFDRINHTIELTHYGESLLALAKDMENLETEIKSLNRDPKSTVGNLKIAVLESIVSGKFLKVCSKFHDIYPKIQLVVTTGSSSELVQKIIVNDVDLILTLSDASASENVQEIYSVEVPLVFITNKKNSLCAEENITLDKLTVQNLVLTESISIYYMKLMSLFHKNGLFPSPSIQLKSTHAIIEYVKFNDCISFVPYYCVSDEIKKGTISALHY